MTRKTFAYAAVTVGVCAAFVGSGIANVAYVPHVALDMQHLGYPHYFSARSSSRRSSSRRGDCARPIALFT